jgi:spore maturation protein CgeB
MSKEQVKTLLLEFNGGGRRAIVEDTLFSGVLGLRSKRRWQDLAYIDSWRSALCGSPVLDIVSCNVNDLVGYFRNLRRIKEYQLIIVGHGSVHSKVLMPTASWLIQRRGKLVVLGSNEYTHMADKIEFIQATKADFICSQLPLETAKWLYQECTDSRVLSTPHALNPDKFHPDPSVSRSIDIGFLGDLYHSTIGDMERTNLIQFFQAHGSNLGLNCDIRFHRVPVGAWADFLRHCKGIVGAESGTYYLSRTGQTIDDAKAYINANPSATFEQVFDSFFKHSQDTISGKCVSSRHFEPIGTKTCQILVEGDYNGILVADEHYISVKKDLSNIDDVVARIKDEAYRVAMVERTYEYVMAEHTYQHRINSMLEVVLP